MKLLRDEQAYRQILDDFVARRQDARDFVRGFRTLWDGDRADSVARVREMQRGEPGSAGLYGFLDSVSELCTAYMHCLPADAGYRVSEEQFRKEIEAMANAWPDPSRSGYPPGHWRDGRHHLS